MALASLATIAFHNLCLAAFLPSSPIGEFAVSSDLALVVVALGPSKKSGSNRQQESF